MKTTTIKLTPDGKVEFIHDDEIASALVDAVGVATKERASHVEPTSFCLRLCFHAIRSLVRDDSRLAGFTRRWRCKWRARIFNGPTLGPFGDRGDAIAAEVAWLESNRF